MEAGRCRQQSDRARFTGGEWQLRIGPGDLLQFIAYGTGGDAVIDCSAFSVTGTGILSSLASKTAEPRHFWRSIADRTRPQRAIDEIGSELYIGSDAAGNGLLGKIDQVAIL